MEQRQSVDFLTTEEAAVEAGVAIRTIYRWIENGLPTNRPGGNGHYRIRRDDLRAYLQGTFNQDVKLEGKSSDSAKVILDTTRHTSG